MAPPACHAARQLLISVLEGLLRAGGERLVEISLLFLKCPVYEAALLNGFGADHRQGVFEKPLRSEQHQRGFDDFQAGFSGRLLCTALGVRNRIHPPQPSQPRWWRLYQSAFVSPI